MQRSFYKGISAGKVQRIGYRDLINDLIENKGITGAVQVF